MKKTLCALLLAAVGCGEKAEIQQVQRQTHTATHATHAETQKKTRGQNANAQQSLIPQEDTKFVQLLRIMSFLRFLTLKQSYALKTILQKGLT